MNRDNSQNILGVNSADNQFDSTAVVANANGSIVERLEAIQGALLVDGTSNPIGVNDADNLFDSSAVVANADGSVLERLEFLQAASITDGVSNPIGVNDADNLFDSSAVVANADGSVLERLEFIQAASITDSVANPIGVNDANNAFDSTNVVADANGSVFERLEYIQANMINPATPSGVVDKILATTANGVTPIFNYTGAIRIKSITGTIKTIMQNKVQTMKLAIVSDALVSYDICANKDIDTFAAGTLLSITGTAADAMLATTAVGVLAPGQVNAIFATCVTSGVINVTAGAANTGAITWSVQWEPISAGATLVAA